MRLAVSSGYATLRCSACEQVLDDPSVFMQVYDEAVHCALALNGSPVPQQRTFTASALRFQEFTLQEACRQAGIRHAQYAVVKELHGGDTTYFPGILQGLGERPYQRLVLALRELFSVRNPAGGVARWSAAVQANGNNPIGSIFVCRNSVIEEVGEVHQIGAFAR